MTSKRILAAFVAIFAIVFAVAMVSAANEYVTINDLEVNGIDVLGGINVAEFSGNTVPVRVQFIADNLPGSDSEDVRVKAWISGARGNSAVTERFDVLSERTYAKTLSVEVPSDLDEDELEENLVLNVLIESRNDGLLADDEVEITVQRDSYRLDVLDVDMPSHMSTGEVLPVDVVLKNIGRQLADDTFVVARIPALGVEDKAYFGDLSSLDQEDPDRENTNERRLTLRVPKTAPEGIYAVEVEAYNSDSIAKVTERVVIQGASAETIVVAPVRGKTLSVGDTAVYSLTVANTGNNVKVYEFVVDSSSMDVSVSEPVVALSAGTSRTINLEVTPSREGTQNFAVNIHSGSELVKTESFTANVEGTTIAGDATVLLTVILAIIFVVLVVVLIVLLTRKPEKNEEFGESYY